jgi:RNA polymerase sigma-70 factor (ECF subfamily)
VDEVLQRVRTKLLVGEGDSATTDRRAPLLGTYTGKGALLGWVRAVAVHEALSEKRKDARRGPTEGPSAIERLAIAGDDAELARMRAAYAEPFRAAFREALASLAAKDRNVLRLVYVDGLTAEQVGLAYGVHRVSVARWLGQIRESLFDRTRARLLSQLQVSANEMQSLTRMCLSQIDVSMERLLAELE